ISDLILTNYETKDITEDVKKTAKPEDGRYGEPKRLKLTLPATTKPIVIDVKVPYKEETGGVGTGMDWTVDNSNIYWKADYYESVQDIIVGDPTKAAAGDIKGSYISEGSLDVANEKEKFQFKLKKVKESDNTKAIQGAVFKLTGPDKGDDTKQDERFMTTGTYGMITFAGLEAGTYKLEEETPAPGYEKANTDWTVRITANGKVYIKDNKAADANNSFTVATLEESATNNLMRRLQMAGANTELAISGNLVDTLNPLRAGTWEVVDSDRSDEINWRQDYTDSELGLLVDTKIIEIDKTNHKYRQVFLFPPYKEKQNREIKFHRAHDQYDIKRGDATITTYVVPNNTSLADIDSTSDINNLADKTDISSKIAFSDRRERSEETNQSVYKIRTRSVNKTYPGYILMVVETSYNPGGYVGLGVNYNYNLSNINKSKNWLEKFYTSENAINNIKSYNITLSTPDNNGSLTISPNKTKG
ncbi:MAG: prealbumin-like fold domain-containing protein, partial [Anaerococcus prevotii]|nr:prealbumin-like fold domain-containing protein [Anaerococcus prevotii]